MMPQPPLPLGEERPDKPRPSTTVLCCGGAVVHMMCYNCNVGGREMQFTPVPANTQKEHDTIMHTQLDTNYDGNMALVDSGVRHRRCITLQCTTCTAEGPQKGRSRPHGSRAASRSEGSPQRGERAEGIGEEETGSC